MVCYGHHIILKVDRICYHESQSTIHLKSSKLSTIMMSYESLVWFDHVAWCCRDKMFLEA